MSAALAISDENGETPGCGAVATGSKLFSRSTPPLRDGALIGSPAAFAKQRLIRPPPFPPFPSVPHFGVSAFRRFPSLARGGPFVTGSYRRAEYSQNLHPP